MSKVACSGRVVRKALGTAAGSPRPRRPVCVTRIVPPERPSGPDALRCPCDGTPDTPGVRWCARSCYPRVMSAAERILSEVLSLPETERAKLAHRILESLEDVPSSEIEAAWLGELERRARAVEAGAVEPVPWETARTDILAELRKRRAARHTP